MPLRENRGDISPHILHLMKSLDLTEEQAAELAETDKRIDKGENLFGLSQEGKRVERAMKQTTAVDAYGKTRTRERKTDIDKAELIKVIADAVAVRMPTSQVVVENAEREITLQMNGRKFKIVLSAPRT